MPHMQCSRVAKTNVRNVKTPRHKIQVWVYKTIQLKTSLQTQRHCKIHHDVGSLHLSFCEHCAWLLEFEVYAIDQYTYNQQVLKVELQQELRTDHLYATYKYFEIHGYESKGYKQRSYSITFWNLYQFIHLWHIAKLRTNVNKTSGHGLSHFDITTYFIRP